jgi:hypothetical protein
LGDWGCGSVVEPLPSMYKALVLTSNHTHANTGVNFLKYLKTVKEEKYFVAWGNYDKIKFQYPYGRFCWNATISLHFHVEYGCRVE